MDILHCAVTTTHNAGIRDEGSYRVEKFPVTVSQEEIDAIRTSTMRYVAAVHSQRHVQKMKGACRSKRYVAEIPLTMASFEAMIASAALAIMAAERHAFAVTRPAGHHATKEIAQGFCFFNNVAIGARTLLDSGKRVCIIDIDGHYGNGTESIFRHEQNVLLCSIHQENAYPLKGRANNIGRSESYGHVVNIPLLSGSGDDIFLEAIGCLQSFITQFNPDHVAISAGFDGYHSDSLLNLQYTERGFWEAGRIISSFGKPVFAVLEGGYHNAVRECVEALISGLSGGESPDISISVSDSTHWDHFRETLKIVKKSHAHLRK